MSSPESWFIDSITGRLTDSGITISPNLALNLSAVYRCALIRSGTISKMPLQTFARTKKGRLRVDDNSSYLLEKRPNKRTTPSQFKKMISFDIDFWGNSYILIGKNRSYLKRLEPYRVEVLLMSDESLNYKYYNEISKKYEVFSDNEIMHYKELSTDGILGKSKIQLARETVFNSKASNKLLKKYFTSGTLAKGILVHPGNLEKLSKDNIKLAWKKANAGVDNAYDIPVLDGGLEYKDISMSFEDAQFLNLAKFSVEEIARFFNVPTYMLGIMDGAKFNNVQSQAMDFITNSIQPLLTDIEEETQYKYYYTSEKNRGYYCKFNMAVAMRADDITRAEFYEKMLNNGIYTINKCLVKEDEDQIGEKGDVHYRSLNYVDIEIMNEYQLSKANSLKGGEKIE